MSSGLHLDEESGTLSPIPRHMHHWLRAIVTFGFLSFVASFTLLVILSYKLVRWQVKARRSNQFVFLICNLLLADIQQSLAFLLNVEWLRRNSVTVGTSICWTQGWFVSTGDLSSGLFCLAIAVHTFSSVILNYRLKNRWFYTVIGTLWVFVYGVSLIPVGMYRENLFVRAGPWCWIHHDLDRERLWTHYFFIFACELGNIIVYALIYIMLIQRIGSNYYTPAEADRVKSISNLMVVYPLVYIFCTLPLASARMASMKGQRSSLPRLCLAGAMITSSGWLDVLLYTFTRRIMIFSDEPPAEDIGFETFQAIWAEKSKRFRTHTTVEALHVRHPRPKPKRSMSRMGRALVSLPSTNESSDNLCRDQNIKLVTTTQVVSTPAEPADYEEMAAEIRRMRPSTPVGRWSEESGKEFQLERIED